MVCNKISVIVPIFGVQEFIGRCVTSLFNQTMKDVEFIFVNDATQDRSMDILKDVISKYPDRNVMVIEHDQNRGLPDARNTGLKSANGKYVFHCDADDYVEPEMLATLYSKAEQYNADVVWCDWFLTFMQNERYMSEPEYSNVQDAVCGMLSGTMRYNVWNKLIKRSLYVDNNIVFPSGYAMGEDMTMIRLIACARRIVYAKGAFYHYVRTNSNAYTKTFNRKALTDLHRNVDATLAFIEDFFPEKFINEKNYFKLNAKLPFLITNESNMYKVWEKWYPESNAFILYNRKQPLYTRLLQWMAWRGHFWFVKLYYYVLIRFRYGFVYK